MFEWLKNKKQKRDSAPHDSPKRHLGENSAHITKILKLWYYKTKAIQYLTHIACEKESSIPVALHIFSMEWSALSNNTKIQNNLLSESK